MIELLNRTVDAIFRAGDYDDPRAHTWDRLREQGLLTPFQQGLTAWSEGAQLIRAASRHAPGVPFTEQVVSSYLCAALNISEPPLFASLADPHTSKLVMADQTVSGRAAWVPHAAVSSHVWLAIEAHEGLRLALAEVRGVEASAGENLAGEPRDTLLLHDVPVVHAIRIPRTAEAEEARSDARSPSPDADPLTQGRSLSGRRLVAPREGSFSPLAWLGALARATQMAALAEEVLAQCVEHANTRTQFGSAVARFQAVQQQLAVLACEVAALHCAVAAAERAADAAGALRLAQAGEAIAAAKIQAGTTARVAVQVGHAVHAAIGFTREHRLHRYTQRLLSYRAEFGPERVFARWLGARTQARGSDELWHHLVASDQAAG